MNPDDYPKFSPAFPIVPIQGKADVYPKDSSQALYQMITDLQARVNELEDYVIDIEKKLISANILSEII